ncbi:MAG: pyridoxamine 5'-phosphate oxidase family protein [Bacteroidota bacterium]
MGDTKDLTGRGAVKEIQDLIEDINSCMFCTYSSGKLKSRPMSVQKADDEGNIWFLSDKNSGKNKEIMADDGVDLLFGQGQDKWLALHGRAEISFDKQKIKELWAPIAKIWFTDGANDPDISVIKVAYDDGYYWDNKHGRMVALAKMAAAFVTGKTMDDGIEGKLKK